MGRIAVSGQLGAWEHNCPAAEHCCIVASPEELEHEVVTAELEKGPHLPEVLEPQEPSVGLGAVEVGRTFGHP